MLSVSKLFFLAKYTEVTWNSIGLLIKVWNQEIKTNFI